MLFHCQFAEHNSLLVDQPTKEAATVVATKEAEGEAPTLVRLWPANTFCADVYLDVDAGEEGDIEDLVVDPLPHVAELLYEWEGEEDAATGPLCGDTNLDDNDREVTCAKLRHGKDEDHQSAEGLVWP